MKIFVGKNGATNYSHNQMKQKMETELSESQKAKLESVAKLMEVGKELLREVDEELFAQGSFPESPIGNLEFHFKLDIDMIRMWIRDGVEI